MLHTANTVEFKIGPLHKFIIKILLPAVPRAAAPSVVGAVGKIAAAVSVQIALLKALVDSGINPVLFITESVTAGLL